METEKVSFVSGGIRLAIKTEEQEAERVYLYLIRNGLHPRPYALMEDLFVHPHFRRK